MKKAKSCQKYYSNDLGVIQNATKTEKKVNINQI